MGDGFGERLKPVAGQELTFQTTGVGKPVDATMIPLYEVRHQRYTVYWKMGTELGGGK